MKKLILVTLVLCMALSACTKAEVGKAPTAESAAASSVESTASGGKSAASEVSLPEKTKTAAHVTKTLSSGVVVDADVTMPESMQKTELPEMKGTGHGARGGARGAKRGVFRWGRGGIDRDRNSG